MKHFLPFLPRKKDEVEAIPLSSTTADKTSPLTPSNTAVWASMSARVGSTSQNSLGGWYSYRSSKAGVNALTKSFDIHLKNTAGEKAMGVALHPGTVKTGLSKDFWSSVEPDKLFSVEQAAGYLLDVVGSMKIDQRGRCWDWEGKEIPP
jgi:NAD(P)-dependent dehydrogenase (short-subunit alcohol dehydrogenase family)